jgi:phosphohistidine phosphatase
MELYIVRHGIAEERSPGRPDAERALTSRGRRRTRQAAEGLRALGGRPERMATSPLVRCDETARIIADVICPDVPLEVQDFLAPGATARDLLQWLRGCREGSAMVVGHAPDVSAIAGGLLTREGIDILFKKAAACCISFEDRPALGAGCLMWLLQPSQLRALGTGGCAVS